MHPVLAVALALASTVCYAVAAALQQHEAARQSARGLRLVAALVRRPRWCAAVLASLLGGLLHLGALGAGPLVLVQPLGVTVLVFALPIGAWLGRVRVSRRSWIGAACVAVGLPGVLAMVPHRAGAGRSVSTHSSVALAITVLVVVVAATATVVNRRRPRAGGVLFAAGAALCFGLASGVARAVWLHRAGPTLIVAGLMAMAGGVVLAQHAYRASGLGAPLAVLTLADPLTAACVGVVVLGEPILTSPLRICLGLAGLAATTVGVVLLSSPHTTSPTVEADTPPRSRDPRGGIRAGG